MAKKTININSPDDFINIGSAPNSRNGDSVRAAFARLNNAIDDIDLNFQNLYDLIDGYDLTNAIPILTGNSGKYLTNNGSTLSWDTIDTPTEITSNNHTLSIDSNGNVTIDGDPITVDYYVPINHVPPANPVSGELWYDTESGRTYIYYDTAWVDANPKGATGTTIPNQNGHAGEFLTTDGSNLSWTALGDISLELDGGSASTVYDGIPTDGGGA